MAATGNSLLSEEDLQKALAEIEGQTDEPGNTEAATSDALPPIDRAAPIARPQVSQDSLEIRPSPDNVATAQDLDAQLAAAALNADASQCAAKNKRRFTVNRKSGAAAKEAANHATAALAALAKPKGSDEPPKKPTWTLPKPLKLVLGFFYAGLKGIYRAIDLTLETISRPIEKLNSTWRLAIGFSGGIASIFAMVLIVIGPSLRPKRDAITFVHEKRYELEHPRPKPAEKEPAAGGHGDKKERPAEKKPEKEHAEPKSGHH